MATTLSFTPIFERVCAALIEENISAYLVGGAVRDALLSKPIHDYDFILPGDALKVARRLADQLGAAYFPLDVERGTARLIYSLEGEQRHMLDFAALRGPDLESDLRARDFTVNAIAIDVSRPQELLDPLGGAADLLSKTLRSCSQNSFRDDPVRILRAIRMAAGFDLKIPSEVRNQMRESVHRLPRVSPERLRDELFRILEGKKPHTAIQVLELLGVLPFVLPELPALKDISQSAPHIKEVWGHTLDVVRNLEAILSVLTSTYDPDSTGNLITGLASLRLGRYRQQFIEHLSSPLVPDRNLRPLLFLAALYHDIAKPQTRQVEDGGRIRFIGHERVGEGVIAGRGRALRLSNDEIARQKTIVRHHMRPSLLAHESGGPSRRAIYRFFRDTGVAGVDICLLSLADVWATYGTTLPQDRWERQLDVVRALLEAWWERPEQQVRPKTLVTGHELIDQFGLEPGPKIGELLEALREAQAVGDVNTPQEALNFARERLNDQSHSNFKARE
jgi:poly(A) polymerase